MSGQTQRPATFEDAIWLELEAIHGTLRAIEGHARWLAGIGTFFVVLACVGRAISVASAFDAFWPDRRAISALRPLRHDGRYGGRPAR